MSRYARKVDDNHTAVVERFEALGFAVQSLAAIGNGCPDLLVSRGQKTACVEVKDGAKVPSARRVNDGQRAWWSRWKGKVFLVEKLDDVNRIEEAWRNGL